MLRSRIASRIAAVAAATILAGCALVEEAFDPPPEPVVMTLPEPVAAPPEPLPLPPKRRPTRTARLSAPPEHAQPATAASVPETLPGPEPPAELKLFGLSREQALFLLGSPSSQRDSAPAKIWQFVAGECVVDVYFYLDVARNEFYALHYNVNDLNSAIAGDAAERCLQRIYSEHRK